MSFDSFDIPPKPGSIANFKCLETEAKTKQLAVVRILEKEKSDGDGIVGNQFVFKENDTAEYIRTIAKLFALITGEEKPDPTETKAYRALSLGVEIAHYLLHPAQPALYCKSFIENCEGTDAASFHRYTHQAPEAYLAERPYLLGLIERFAPDIAGRYEEVEDVVHVSAHSLLQVDQALFMSYTDAQVAELEASLNF